MSAIIIAFLFKKSALMALTSSFISVNWIDIFNSIGFIQNFYLDEEYREIIREPYKGGIRQYIFLLGSKLGERMLHEM